MQTAAQPARMSTTTLWTGRLLSAFVILFLLLDYTMKVLNLPAAIEATTGLGYPEAAVRGIGVLGLVCLTLYALPRSAVLGAILLTGYLGGAVATHVQSESTLFSALFPAVFGLFLWGGLFLRDERLRALLPLSRRRQGARD